MTTFYKWSPALFAVFFIILFSIVTYIENHSSSGAMILIVMLLFLQYIVLVISYWIAALITVFMRRFILATSMLAGGIIVSALPLYGHALGDVTYYAIDYLRLRWNEDYYLREVARRMPEADSKQVSFDWGFGGTVLTSFSYSLVYDEGSLLNAGAGDDIRYQGRCKSSAVHLRSKFYSVSTLCQ